jgi:hypothetical protein
MSKGPVLGFSISDFVQNQVEVIEGQHLGTAI